VFVFVDPPAGWPKRLDDELDGAVGVDPKPENDVVGLGAAARRFSLWFFKIEWEVRRLTRLGEGQNEGQRLLVPIQPNFWER
jgi:hypothetical protein